MRVLRITESQTWDRALLSLPNPHVLQCWAWGEFKSRHGWDVTRLLFQEQDRTVAAASVLQRKLPLLPVSVLYVPRGPALDWTDSALVARVLAELEDLARNRRAVFVKIDPDVYYPDDAPSFSPRPAVAPEMADLLAERNWCFSDEQIQFRNTLLLDLNRSEDELLAAMKQKTRYNVRLAMRRGVTVCQSTRAELDLFYGLYAETSQRDGFAIRPAGYYLDAWGSFLEADQAHLLLAEVEDEVVAGLIVLTFGPTAWYMYGASSGRHRKHMPNQLLQWEAICRAKAAGCTLYDLWGAPDHLDESDPMWGVVRFKLGLGGQLARGLGAWDFGTNWLAYRFYSVVMPRYLNWLRGRHRSSGNAADSRPRFPGS
jgi:lipid II:glycine glycyltransferase (peptidoglycan interpeptide bridge formation enzyme)